MAEMLRLPALQVQMVRDRGGGEAGPLNPGGGCFPGRALAWSSSSTPTLRRKRSKMRRSKNVPSEKEQAANGLLRRAGSGLGSASKEYLQLPSIEITPSSDEDAPWSNCSTPSASPRRKRFLLKKWLKVREKKDPASESSQQSSQQSSHDDDRFLTPFIREERSDSGADKFRSPPASSRLGRPR
ncbi:hypothetical protein AAFF_G00397790 [Aldrovandia affinis]|uniref:Uncharacterized protein n=1 Tax=Aldrovandia affinis TaxID=143900 RepID=A0AAD7SD50_9TELE|nr:hypothetical protein AAFF_G00397790 [Aldrovandia affinis]